VHSKRLVGVISVRDGWAVQSFGYRRYLPLGRPEVLAENLDRWGADEILLVCLDRTRTNLGPDFELLRRLGERGLSTPLIYSGGIRSIDDAKRVVQLGADRICLDALLHEDPETVKAMSGLIGSQALIASLPLSMGPNGLEWLDYRDRSSRSLVSADHNWLLSGIVSEALVIDWKNEGCNEGFDNDLAVEWPWPQLPMIAFGGISEPTQAERLLSYGHVVAVGIGNSLAYREHSIQYFKKRLLASAIRSAEFSSSGVL
jgi:cyclase